MHVYLLESNSNRAIFSNMLKKLGHTVGKLPSDRVASDIVIADVSRPDTKLGLELAQVMTEGKTVYAFYDISKSAKIKPLIVGSFSGQIKEVPYEKKSLENTLKDILERASHESYDKFSITIPPSLQSYLEWVSKRKKVSRATFLRSLIEEKMRRDTQYRLANL